MEYVYKMKEVEYKNNKELLISKSELKPYCDCAWTYLYNGLSIPKAGNFKQKLTKASNVDSDLCHFCGNYVCYLLTDPSTVRRRISSKNRKRGNNEKQQI